MTKNMEDLLWRGDSLDRELAALGNRIGSLSDRHVASFDIVTVRIGKVSESGAEYQPRAVIKKVGASGRNRAVYDSLYMVAVFLRAGMRLRGVLRAVYIGFGRHEHQSQLDRLFESARCQPLMWRSMGKGYCGWRWMGALVPSPSRFRGTDLAILP
jgi:hypothetical protein